MAVWVAARTLGPVDRALEAPLPLPPTVAGRVAPPPPPVRAIPAPPAGPRLATAPMAQIASDVAPPTTLRPATPAALPATYLSQRDAGPRSLPSAPAAPAPATQAPYRAPPPPAQLPFGAVPPEVRAARRWSADGWVLWREKSAAGAALVGSGTYGASQAGAVLRYRLFPDSRFDPRAYLRVTATLSGEDEKEAAAGIAVRPLRALPVDLMVEGRVLRFTGDPRLRPSETRVRPAAMAVIGPPPVSLPLELRAEAYAQIGYVGGEGATAFADGQVRAVRDIDAFTESDFRLEAGVGGWGGAQKGVERADIGPTVAVRFPVGDRVFARAGLDWRHRVVGQAEPGSGPVLTLSAGF